MLALQKRFEALIINLLFVGNNVLLGEGCG
jgi:hypothetical protein